MRGSKYGVSRMTLESVPSFEAQALHITQSQFLLARYKIQVISPEKVDSSPIKVSEDLVVELERNRHYHAGPVALEHYVERGACACNKDNCIQLWWCLFIPCLGMSDLLFSCFTKCCNWGSACMTNLEEKHTMENCFHYRCCLLVDDQPRKTHTDFLH